MGAMVYGENEQELFLGREVTRSQSVSEKTAQKIDVEVRKLIDNNYGRAKKILVEHMDQLHLLADALIEYETLESSEIDDVMAGKKLHRAERREPFKKPPEDPSAEAPDVDSHVPSKEAGQES